MSWAHPQTRTRRLMVWVALLALASLTLLAERPLEAWQYDFRLNDVGRRKLAAYALRQVPDELVHISLHALFARDVNDDRELFAITRESRELLAARRLEHIVQAAASAERPLAQEAFETLATDGATVRQAVVQAMLRAPEVELRLDGLSVLERTVPPPLDAASLIVPLGRDPEPRVRAAALRTLTRISPRSQELFRVGLNSTRDPDQEVRDLAWQSIVRSPHLLEIARDPLRAPNLAAGLRSADVDPPPALLEALQQGLGVDR